MRSTEINSNKLLTSSEASRLLHIHTNTLRRWSSQGLIKFYVICSRGDRRYRTKDLEYFLLHSYR
jgi:DNA-binding transcriptional MerR regulator